MTHIEKIAQNISDAEYQRDSAYNLLMRSLSFVYDTLLKQADHGDYFHTLHFADRQNAFVSILDAFGISWEVHFLEKSEDKWVKNNFFRIKDARVLSGFFHDLDSAYTELSHLLYQDNLQRYNHKELASLNNSFQSMYKLLKISNTVLDIMSIESVRAFSNKKLWELENKTNLDYDFDLHSDYLHLISQSYIYFSKYRHLSLIYNALSLSEDLENMMEEYTRLIFKYGHRLKYKHLNYLLNSFDNILRRVFEIFSPMPGGLINYLFIDIGKIYTNINIKESKKSSEYAQILYHLQGMQESHGYDMNNLVSDLNDFQDEQIKKSKISYNIIFEFSKLGIKYGLSASSVLCDIVLKKANTDEGLQQMILNHKERLTGLKADLTRIHIF